MAIEGPLRELGIHDVFQLLDLSRKTGTLRVTSALRDEEGTVLFEQGAVVGARMRSQPEPLAAALLRAGKLTEEDIASARQAARGGRLGDALVASGAISARELDRQARAQVESVVFDLMSWEEGFFSFVEGTEGPPPEAAVRISTESLLMEGARRIDEWARIAHKVPHLGLVPVLAPTDEAHDAQLDLRPGEWETLAAIDGTTDLRSIALGLGRTEFDVARVAYGLVSTGVIELRDPQSFVASSASSFDDVDPMRADTLRRAGTAAARSGDLELAIGAWRSFLASAPSHPDAVRVREALEGAERLHAFIGEDRDG